MMNKRIWHYLALLSFLMTFALSTGLAREKRDKVYPNVSLDTVYDAVNKALEDRSWMIDSETEDRRGRIIIQASRDSAWDGAFTATVRISQEKTGIKVYIGVKDGGQEVFRTNCVKHQNILFKCIDKILLEIGKK